MKTRILVIVLSLTLLILLCIHFAHHNPWLSLNQCLENPKLHDGRTVTRFREPRIAEIHTEGFLLKQKSGKSIPVIADTTGLIPGKYIGLVAVFHKEGYLEAVHLKVSQNRRYKIGLSILPALLVLALFFRFFRWDRKSKSWRPEINA